MSNSDMPAIVKKNEDAIGAINLNMMKKRSDGKGFKKKTKGMFSNSNKELNQIRAQKKAQQGVLQFFWNYNTVEATLLFCATLVLLSGLMFQDQTAIVPGSVREVRQSFFFSTALHELCDSLGVVVLHRNADYCGQYHLFLCGPFERDRCWYGLEFVRMQTEEIWYI
jgi:hypothetical protein